MEAAKVHAMARHGTRTTVRYLVLSVHSWQSLESLLKYHPSSLQSTQNGPGTTMAGGVQSRWKAGEIEGAQGMIARRFHL